jgi:hypothetical protein
MPGTQLRARVRQVCNQRNKTKSQRAKHTLTAGVSDGTRTRDIQDHNLTLYQLNYTHHC